MPVRPLRANNKCCKPRCPNEAVSLRARFCVGCLKAKAKVASLNRLVYGGNPSAKGQLGNSGNRNAKGHPANSGNSNAKGIVGNRGNTRVGSTKKRAAKRSALRRSSKMVLVVKSPWLELILSKKKTWEIRHAHTKQRGKVHLALSGAGGLILGQCHITNSVAIDKKVLRTNFAKHRIRDLSIVKYQRPHAWVMSKVLRYRKPFFYTHPQGAIKWVKL